MKIEYLLNNKKFIALTSDDNITIRTTKTANSFCTYLTAKEDIVLVGAKTTLPFEFNKKDSYFLNGYESWTETKEFSYCDKMKDLDKGPFKKIYHSLALHCYGDHYFYKHNRKTLHGFDVAYIKGNNQLFIGNLNYKLAYLIIEFVKDKKVINLISDIENKVVKKGETICIFNYVIYNDVKKGIDEYFANFKCKENKKLFGYTSWYNHYQNINEDIILNALDKADSRFDLFQIDDGFETYVGDWLSIDKTKFPNGLKGIVDKIHSKNMLAGIWLAPFTVEVKSQLVKDHPDWIAKNEKGEFIKAGANWSGSYALDLNNVETINYIKEFLKYYKDLGFDFFKLDFLYCTQIKPIKNMTRAETADFAYGLLRKELDGKLILGCGAVLSNAYGNFDYMRIGPDVSLKFDDVWYMRLLHRERNSTKHTLQNTIYRSIFNGHYFLNDPDVMLLRDDNIDLTKKQRYALTKINSLFGSLLMTSDNPKDYNEEKKKVLEEALSLFNNGKVIEYVKKGNNIIIKYSVNNENKVMTYNTKKGVIL